MKSPIVDTLKEGVSLQKTQLQYLWFHNILNIAKRTTSFNKDNKPALKCPLFGGSTVLCNQLEYYIAWCEHCMHADSHTELTSLQS